MLKRIELENYRCFQKSSISLKDLVIIVGKNNSGKSSLIEALRIVAMASRKCKKTHYIDAPATLGLRPEIRGFRLPVDR